ncbi:MAG: site-specific integrase, partial [Planctomycetes bacterium]|nr:site-specific integrase [Planctomycetota bacterium]
MNKLVKVRTRPSRDGRSFKYYIDYIDENGKRKQISLGHADRKKAESKRAQKERELRMGIVEPESMRLSVFLKDSMTRTGNQVRESTHDECRYAINHLIEVVGDIDIQRITLKHGELFRQKCLDKGNSPATVKKKLAHLKRMFQLATNRKQLDENPLQHIAMPKVTKKKVEKYTASECERMIKAARDSQTDVKWDMLIITALCTGMRRSELLNCTWADIDFSEMTVDVSPKKSTGYTWEWLIKDTDRRELPLTQDVIQILADHQNQQPEGYPYVFVPPARYDHIQQLRQQGKWSLRDSRLKVINNFSRKFGDILKMAHVRKRKFHCLRNTALTNWFANGMSEHDV